MKTNRYLKYFAYIKFCMKLFKQQTKQCIHKPAVRKFALRPICIACLKKDVENCLPVSGCAI